MKDNYIIPVILCGGTGTRLWPLSRESFPKQYLKLLQDNEFTLLQKTMLMAEGTTRQINPGINMWELSRPLIDKWITDTHDPFKVLEEWFHKNKIALLKIPEIINKIDEILSKK